MPLPGNEPEGQLSLRQQLRSLFREWRKWNKVSDDVLNNEGETVSNDQKQQELERLEKKIDGFLDDYPRLAPMAEQFDYVWEPPKDDGGKPETDGTSGGDGGDGGDGGGNNGGTGPGSRSQAQNNRLLGDFGKEFTLVRGPKGTYVAKYSYKIAGEVINVGIKLGKGPDALAKYGLKVSDAKELTKEQMKRIKNVGWADELTRHFRQGDKSVFKSLSRHLRNQYEGQSVLEDDEVMSVVIANSMFGWAPGEFENKLRNTSWYKNTNEWQRDWVTVKSPKQKQEEISQTLETVVNRLEDFYGLDWMTRIDGGMDKARAMATKIASGQWGEPGRGMQFWMDRQSDKAGAIEGTPEWYRRQAEQEQINAQANRPEDMAEDLRSQAMNYLGQTNGQPLLDRATLKQWANDLVTGTASQSDWEKFLRRQMKNLHPYFDENQSYSSQASPYRSTAEALFGTSTTWDDPLYKKIAAVDDKGALTGTAMSLHDFEQYIRNNDDRFWANPATESKGLGFLSELMFRTSGVR